MDSGTARRIHNSYTDRGANKSQKQHIQDNLDRLIAHSITYVQKTDPHSPLLKTLKTASTEIAAVAVTLGDKFLRDGDMKYLLSDIVDSIATVEEKRIANIKSALTTLNGYLPHADEV